MSDEARMAPKPEVFDFTSARHDAPRSAQVKDHWGRVTLDVLCPIVCADGFTMSVQASANHYCAPRETGAWYYDQVEVGFPSAIEPLLLEYAENDADYLNTVYGWVPVEVVDAIVAAHGGFARWGE